MILSIFHKIDKGMYLYAYMHFEFLKIETNPDNAAMIQSGPIE